MKTLTTMMVLVAAAGVGLLLAVAVGDPLLTTVTAYDLNGLGGQATDIHKTLVQYVPIAAVATAFIWAVFRILRTERQRGGGL
jgi:hypothetical protein